MSQQERFCQACGMPMSAEEAKSASDDYCAWCCDSEGKLKSWRMPFPAWLSSSIPGRKLGLRNRASERCAI